MALVPLKQQVTVYKAGASDGWGESTKGAATVYNVRVEEATEVDEIMLSRIVDRKEAVTTLKVFFDKQPPITYDDTIEYTDELGVTVKRKPVKIKPSRMLSGKVVLTVVYV